MLLDHEAIVEAVRARDSARSREAMRVHIHHAAAITRLAESRGAGGLDMGESGTVRLPRGLVEAWLDLGEAATLDALDR
jgi:hypothetical protein